jgi:hypothetical protein
MIFENSSRRQVQVVEQGKSYVRVRFVNDTSEDSYWFTRDEFKRYFHVNAVVERPTRDAKPKRVNMRVRQAH